VPPAEGAGSDIDTDFHDLRSHQDGQSVSRLPHAAGQARPAQGWPPRAGASRPGDRAARRPGRRVVQLAYRSRPSWTHMPSIRERGSGQSAGDRADDRLRRLAHPLVKSR
jgi:hypothetical protein